MRFLGIALFILVIISLEPKIYGQQKDFLVNLNGTWKFQIGDSLQWNQPEYNDTQWENIIVPSAWEDQGFYGYNGYAWYRRDFTIQNNLKNKELFVNLGYIDDIDQVFLNGKLIGFAGSFPPHFATALDVPRKYPIPYEFLDFENKNVIAVRVYDQHMSGGILSGNIGIYVEKYIQPDISLNGIWKFRAGDNLAWKAPNHNDKSWNLMVVPGSWKNHGYKDYNGIAWYRTQVTIPVEYENQKLSFIVGRIDHCDEIYINGTLIGSTGTIITSKKKLTVKSETEEQTDELPEACSKMRIYTIPDELEIAGKTITVAVRVYNTNFRGGIVEGSIGFIKTSTLAKLQKDKNLLPDNN